VPRLVHKTSAVVPSKSTWEVTRRESSCPVYRRQSTKARLPSGDGKYRSVWMDLSLGNRNEEGEDAWHIAVERIARRRCIPAREKERTNEGRKGTRGVINFKRVKTARGRLREIDGATREVRAREAVSGSFARSLSSDSDHQTRKSRHPESSSVFAPSAPSFAPSIYMRTNHCNDRALCIWVEIILTQLRSDFPRPSASRHVVFISGS